MIGMCQSSAQNKQNTLLIHDSRPYVNALANKLKGGGFEDCGSGKNYPHCHIKFAEIDNIHAVKSAHDKLCALALNKQKTKDTQ